jgi:anti-anti-sigma factor
MSFSDWAGVPSGLKMLVMRCSGKCAANRGERRKRAVMKNRNARPSDQDSECQVNNYCTPTKARVLVTPVIYNTRQEGIGGGSTNGANVINESDVEGILILDLQGSIVAGEAAGSVRERTLHAAATSESRNVILNLKGVDYIDSSGLGTLVAAHSTLSKAGGGLALMNLSKRSAELLILTKLARYFGFSTTKNRRWTVSFRTAKCASSTFSTSSKTPAKSSDFSGCLETCPQFRTGSARVAARTRGSGWYRARSDRRFGLASCSNRTRNWSEQQRMGGIWRKPDAGPPLFQDSLPAF